MPRFSYIARDRAGKRQSGVEEASSKEDIVTRLQGRDLLVIDVSPEEAKGKGPAIAQGGSRKHWHGRVSTDDLALFCRQLATLLGAGVTVLKSLGTISEQVSSRKLYHTIIDLEKGMEQGLSLHESMARHPKIFSDLWVNLVESGEAGGSLPVVLGRLANYLERSAAFKKKIISALIYPAILLFVGLGALLFLTIKIVPTFGELFAGFNIKLPLLTQMLLSVSLLIRKYFIFLLLALVVAAFLFRKSVKTREGKLAFEKFQFRLPVFGEFFRAIVVERFSSNMATLLESGVPIIYSLEISERSVDNLVMADVIRRVKEDVREGKSFSKPLERSGFFEPMVIQMVAIGEEIGELPQMLKKINEFYQEYVETFLVRFTSMFEPIMLVFMGGVIGLMVVGMFLPIFQIATIAG